MVIVAAVDRSDRASGVIDQAGILAERFDEPVHAIYVRKRSEVVDSQRQGISKSDVSNVDEVRAEVKSVAADILADSGITVESDAIGRIGDPADQIVKYATEQDARYIVVSPRRRSQTGKMIFGSVAQSVLLNAECPVVSVLREPSAD